MPIQTKKASILVIEDNAPLATLYITCLQNMGYEVDECFDGNSALEKIQHSQPDLIVLDIMLPFVSGYEILTHLRETMKSKVPVVVLSALSQKENIDKAYALGVRDYIVKSESGLSEICARIEKALIPTSSA